jgi:D-alanyl-D-alanine dipeptidase
MNRTIVYIGIFLVLLTSCNQKREKKEDKSAVSVASNDTTIVKAESSSIKKNTPSLNLNDLPDTAFVKLQDIDTGFVFDMRYASTNNFLEEKVYDCDNCWTRVNVAKALISANRVFQEMGYQIKLYDCFRPREVQYKMWEILSDPRYVANPNKGSIHNRGAAVDITLVDIDTKEELAMGTDFDHFGKEAHFAYTNLQEHVIDNRKTLRKVMEENGFSGIRTEWWHFNLKNKSYPISEQPLCNE